MSLGSSTSLIAVPSTKKLGVERQRHELAERGSDRGANPSRGPIVEARGDGAANDDGMRA